eukprot:340956-Prymnesium_polylepis.1
MRERSGCPTANPDLPPGLPTFTSELPSCCGIRRVSMRTTMPCAACRRPAWGRARTPPSAPLSTLCANPCANCSGTGPQRATPSPRGRCPSSPARTGG